MPWLPKARGKRESWYFIDAPTSGTIINGCTCRDKEQEMLMIEREQFMEMADTLAVSRATMCLWSQAHFTLLLPVAWCLR